MASVNINVPIWRRIAIALILNPVGFGVGEFGAFINYLWMILKLLVKPDG
jgi:hypothetical protein